MVAERTALINQLRAILLERGIVIPQGKCKLEQYLVTLMDEQDAQGLSPRMRMLIVDVRVQWQELDRRIGVFDREFAAFTKENEDARRLATIPGVGVMIASALIAAIGKGHLRARSRSGGVVGSGSSSIDDRRQADASRHQQARQQIFAQVADPRSAGGVASHRRA